VLKAHDPETRDQNIMNHDLALSRRGLLRAAAIASGGVGLGSLFPAWAQTGSPGTKPTPATLSGTDIRLTIGHSAFAVNGKSGHAATVNGTLPAPLLRLREGQDLAIHVRNTLEEDTSIHWHGLLLPFQMDGVPGVSFPGIKPGETFTYRFPIKQAGTYWYHSHSGLQEQQGLYGPIVIDPAGAEPAPYDREHVILLSDWTFLHPHQVIQRLKQEGGFFNRQKQTLTTAEMPLAERLMWGRMRMDPTDIADVTGAAYTYLVNGHGPARTGRGCSGPASGCGCASSTPLRRASSTSASPGLR
jgi:CopA family copper-resistance protein